MGVNSVGRNLKPDVFVEFALITQWKLYRFVLFKHQRKNELLIDSVEAHFMRGIITVWTFKYTS